MEHDAIATRVETVSAQALMSTQSQIETTESALSTRVAPNRLAASPIDMSTATPRSVTGTTSLVNMMPFPMLFPSTVGANMASLVHQSTVPAKMTAMSAVSARAPTASQRRVAGDNAS